MLLLFSNILLRPAINYRLNLFSYIDTMWLQYNTLFSPVYFISFSTLKIKPLYIWRVAATIDIYVIILCFSVLLSGIVNVI